MKFLGEGSFGEVRGNKDFIFKHIEKRFDLEDINRELKTHEVLLGEVEFTQLAPEYCYYPKQLDKYEILIQAYRYKRDLSRMMATQFVSEKGLFWKLDIIMQSALATKKMHDNKLGHFDIKLENILIIDNYNIAFHDFGTTLHEDEFNQLNYPVGTPGYVAPELYKNY